MARPAMKGKAIVGRVAKQHGKSGSSVKPTGGRAHSSGLTSSRVVTNGGKKCAC